MPKVSGAAARPFAPAGQGDAPVEASTTSPTSPSDALQRLPAQAWASASSDIALPPRADLALLTAGSAGPGARREVSQHEVQRHFQALLVSYRDADFLAATTGSEAACRAVLEAGEALLKQYASLPRRAAARLFSDKNVREVRDHVMHFAQQLEKFMSPTRTALRDEADRDADIVQALIERGGVDWLRVARRADEKLRTLSTLWEDRVARNERALNVQLSASYLPSTPAALREREDESIRKLDANAWFSSASWVDTLVDRAVFNITARASLLDDQVRNTLLNEQNDRVHLLDDYLRDIRPAFDFHVDQYRNHGDLTLTPESRKVLEALVGRLAEFAASVDKMLESLRDRFEKSDPTPTVLDQIIESAWVTAMAAARLLDRRPEPPVALPSGSERDVAAPTVPQLAQFPQPWPGGARAARKKRKGKNRQATHAAGVTSAAGANRAVLDAAAAPHSDMVVVRSELGTPRLVTAVQAAQLAQEQADHRARTEAAVLMWQHPISAEELRDRLARLDNLLAFDLAAQQRGVSRARKKLSPESAQYVVEKTVQRLSDTAAEMAACLTGLGTHERRQLNPGALGAVHDKTRRLRVMLAEIKGQARSLQDGLATATADHTKTYAYPTQEHILGMLQRRDFATVGAPRPLRGEPGTLFEVELQPSALSNGARPRPLWLHIHTSRPVGADDLRTMDDASFAASHVKSDAERGRNRDWQDARAREGYERALIYRGRLTPEVCRSLLSTNLC